MQFRVKIFCGASVAMCVRSKELSKESCDEYLNACRVHNHYHLNTNFEVGMYVIGYVMKSRYMLTTQFLNARHMNRRASHELASTHIFVANRIQNHVQTNRWMCYVISHRHGGCQ